MRVSEYVYVHSMNRFSFGVVLWVLIRQQKPWPDASDREVMFRVCRGERLSLDNSDMLGNEIDQTPLASVSSQHLLSIQSPQKSLGLRYLLLSQLVRECWEQKPDKRPSMNDVSHALEHSIKELKKSVETVTVQPRDTPSFRWQDTITREVSGKIRSPTIRGPESPGPTTPDAATRFPAPYV